MIGLRSESAIIMNAGRLDRAINKVEWATIGNELQYRSVDRVEKTAPLRLNYGQILRRQRPFPFI